MTQSPSHLYLHPHACWLLSVSFVFPFLEQETSKAVVKQGQQSAAQEKSVMIAFCDDYVSSTVVDLFSFDGRK